MANKKITELALATSLATTDLVPVVTDPAGAAATKKTTLATLIARILTAPSITGGMTVNGNSSVVGTLGATSFSGSGAGLTDLPAGNLTGALPAVSGASLTALNASNLNSGTVPEARLPATLAARTITSLTMGPVAGTNAAFLLASAVSAQGPGSGTAPNASPNFSSPLPDGAAYYTTGGGVAAIQWLEFTDASGRECFIPYFRRA